jgi:2-hydroxychromene-2-carboxylate isomerase
VRARTPCSPKPASVYYSNAGMVGLFSGDTMNARRLGFWFEFGSTHSYLSAARIEGLSASAGVAVLWEPFLLGSIFSDQGWDDLPFSIYPAKGRYMWRDMERQCAKYRIPFEKPTRFPSNGLLAARIAPGSGRLVTERERGYLQEHRS